MQKRLPTLLHERSILIFVLTFFAALWVTQYQSHQYIINPDGVSYLSVAHKYAVGDGGGAINAYWGPMLSWLTVPLLWLGVAPQAASKGVELASGLLFVVAAWLLSGRLRLALVYRTACMLGLVVLAVSWSYLYFTPDLLLAAIILLYLNVLSAPRAHTSFKANLVAGLLGGIGFLTKSFFFPFFIVHFALFHILQGRQSRRYSWRTYLIGMVAFALVCVPWIVTISQKEHHLTYGTSSSYNFAVAGPHSQGHPMHYQGLLRPDSGDVSAWEDPGHLSVESWNPLRSDRKFALHQTTVNFSKYLVGLYVFSGGVALLAIIGLLRGAALAPLLGGTGLLVLLMYSPIVVEERYVWALQAVFAIVALKTLQELSAPFLGNAAKGAAVAIILLSMIVPAFTTLHKQANLGQDEASMARSYHLSHATKIASDANWWSSLYTTYYAGASYYGTIKPGASDDQIFLSLEDNKIDIFFQWNQTPKPAYLKNFNREGITTISGNAVTVYRHD